MTTEIFMTSVEGIMQIVVQPGEYVIGSEGDADIRIDDPSVSPQHARLVVESETVCIQDLDSENGTFVDGDPIVGLTSLYDGQTAVLGSVSLRVRQSVDPKLLGTGPRYIRGGMVAYGGMGAIHEARQSAMGRKVAMKVMLHSWSASSVKRFLDEARITGMLEHPNIVPVHEMGIDEDDQIFYTMKFVRGSTLAEVLAGLDVGNADSLKMFPLAALLTIFQKVCDAVAFAHSRGIWHRDLKPENIMIGDFGEVLVMDWGLAKESDLFVAEPQAGPSSSSGDDDAPPLRTMQGAVLGTPAYMSPEQARGETAEIDQRSDIYALGAILYEILHLQPAVRGKKRDEVVEKVAAGIRDKPEERRLLHLPGYRVPASLEAVCGKAMAFEREKRYLHVPDLQADIAAYQSGFATSAESAGLGRQLMLLVKRNKGVSLSLLAGLVVLFVSTVLFTVNLMRERDRAEHAQKEAVDAQRFAEKKAKEAQESAENAKLMARRESAANQMAAEARDGAEAARAREEEAKMTADQRQKLLDETRSSLAEDAERFARMARLAIAEGRPADALQLLETAVDYDPEHAGHLRQKGLAELAMGKYAGATAAFERALLLDPSSDAQEELDKAKEMRAASAKGEAPPAAIAGLERFLVARRQGLYLRLMDARNVSGKPGLGVETKAQETLEGNLLILNKLGGLASQPSWRSDRVRELQEGLFAVDLRGLDLDKIPDLVDTGVVSLNLEGTQVRDIAPLRGLSLRSLNLAGTQVSNLEPLRNMPELEELRCSTAVADISPLEGAPLKLLDLENSSVTDLEPVRGARLETLRLGGCNVRTLEPVAGQPLKELDASISGLKELALIERMKTLVKLRLPPGTGLVDTSGWPDLKEIFLPDLQPDGPMSADDYRKLFELRGRAWEQYGRALAGLGLKDFGPQRLMVREIGAGFDLDLRGTGISDLRPLARMPVHRLLIDSNDKPLDLRPLESCATLRHLSLENAWVPSIKPLVSNRQLVSLVLSRQVQDTTSLVKHPTLQSLGYSLRPDGLAPPGKYADFFIPRWRQDPDDPKPPSKPRVSFGFDNALEGTTGWTIDDGGKSPPVLLWMADPPAEGGGGGGFLTFYERLGNSKEGFFVLSPPSARDFRDTLGGLMEFRMRAGRELQQGDPPVKVVLISADRQLYYQFPVYPGVKWRTFLAPLTATAGWRVGGLQGTPASEIELKESLSRLREVKILAEFATDALDERTDLDDVRFWDSASGRARIDQFPESGL